MSKSGRPKPGSARSTPPQTSARSKTSSKLFAAAIVLFVVTRCYIAFVLTPWITDVTLYFDYSARVIDRNRTPYRDFAIEYPPMAWWSICAPRLLDERRLMFDHYSPVNASIRRDYHHAYRLEMALFDVLSFGLFLAIVRRRRPQLAGWAALTYIVTSTILCHVLYDHLDEGTLLFSMLGAYVWIRTLGAGRSRLAWSATAFFFFGLGFSYKIIPLIAVPFLLLAQSARCESRGKRGQAPFAGTALRVLRTKGACPPFPSEAAGRSTCRLDVGDGGTVRTSIHGFGAGRFCTVRASRRPRDPSRIALFDVDVARLAVWPADLDFAGRRSVLRFR